MSDDLTPDRVVEPMAPEFWIQFFSQNSPDPGCDVICVGRDPDHLRLRNLLLVLFYAMQNGNPLPFETVQIIIPPTSRVTAELKSELVTEICKTVEAQRGEALPAGEIAALDRRIVVKSLTDFEVSSVLAFLRQVAPKSAVVIANGARYVARLGLDTATSDRSRRAEDAWVPHLNALTLDAIQIARQGEFYVLVDAGEFSPLEADDQELLAGVDGSAFWAARRTSEPSASSIHSTLAEAEHLLTEGLVGAACITVDQIPGLSDEHRLLLKVQLLTTHGRPQEAFALIQPELPRLLPNLDARLLVMLAGLAADSNHPALANTLLDKSVASLEDEPSLAAGLALASRLALSATEAGLESRFSKLFPRSPDLLLHRIARVLSNRAYDDLAILVDTNEWTGYPAELLDLYRHIAHGLNVEHEPNYRELVAVIQQHLPTYSDWAKVLAALDARARGLLATATALVADVDLRGPWGSRAIAVSIDTIERSLIERESKGQSIVSLNAPLTQIIEYLSDNPSAAGTRHRLARVLSVEVCGIAGVLFLAAMSLHLALLPTAMLGATAPDPPPSLPPESIGNFIEAALKYFSVNAPVLMGKARCPESLLTEDPRALLRGVAEVVQIATDNLASEEGRRVTLELLHIAISLAQKSGESEFEFSLLRLVAGKLVLVGHAQLARDLAEGVLEAVTASDVGSRTRQAWYTFADIYHRTGNFHESLLALTCALSQRNATIPQEQAWQETFLLARLLRDLGLTDLSLRVVARSREILHEIGLHTRYGHQLDLVERTVSLRKLLMERDAVAVQDAWLSLISTIRGDCRGAVENGDDPAPSAMLLGQAMHHAKAKGIAIDNATTAAFDDILALVAEPLSTRIRALSIDAPTVEDVYSLVDVVAAARYGEDIGVDIQPAVIAARRLLTSDAATRTAAIGGYAIELLADQTVRPARIGDAADGVAAGALNSPAAIASFAHELAQEGMIVHALAFDELDSLCRFTVEAGASEAFVREPSTIFSREKFNQWHYEYPYRYAYLDTVDAILANTFRRSVLGLGISHTTGPGSRVLIVAEIALQQVPPNIMLIGPNPDEAAFAGQVVAMATAPSLNWLHRVRQGHRTANGRKVAWISTAKIDPGTSGTLDVLAGRLRDTLERHAVLLYTGAEPPEDLTSADLVIIGAHGSLSSEGRYFHVAADEGTLRMTARNLAAQIGSAEVVILFVCHAARADSHPFSSATIGLPHLLLEEGVRAIIASPWPLDARVPSYWLPIFLDESQKGRSVVDANFLANRHVLQAMGEPSHFLAMTVVGDPLVVAAVRP